MVYEPSSICHTLWSFSKNRLKILNTSVFKLSFYKITNSTSPFCSYSSYSASPPPFTRALTPNTYTFFSIVTKLMYNTITISINNNNL